ncbi:MAG: hypothetical protein FWD93_03680 [Coriobacteriia bacterium]|nr:hypothetical protein [Coriobacteriia bacterium]
MQTIIAEILAVLLVVGVVGALTVYMSMRQKRMLRQISEDAVEVATRVLYVKSADQIQFTAYDLSLETGKVRTTRFSAAEIPSANTDELAAWLDTGIADFLSSKEWKQVRVANTVEVEHLSSKLKTLCAQVEPFVGAGTSACWTLHLTSSEGEGLVIVVTKTAPQNHAEFEQALSRFFGT